MPGMNLKFLNNPSQRLATGKSLPLKQLEAIVAYGTAEQRAKVVAKVLPQSYSLCLNRSTQHILSTILTHCDNLVRTQMLYHLRRQLADMAKSPSGNVVVQQLIELLPAIQKKEIAEAFVLNVDPAELVELCKHPYGNHVAQKLVEFRPSEEVIHDALIPHLLSLASHSIGDRVVAKFIENVEGGALLVQNRLFGEDLENAETKPLELLLDSLDESLVVSSLLKHPSVSTSAKDIIISYLIDRVEDFTSLDAKTKGGKTTAAGVSGKVGVSYAEPDFILSAGAAPRNESAADSFVGDASTSSVTKAKQKDAQDTGRHNFAYASAFEYGDDEQRRSLFEALRPRLPQLVRNRGQLVVANALVRFGEGRRGASPRASVVECLLGPVPAASTPAAKKKAALAPSAAAPAVDAADVVAVDPARSLVLRTIMEVDIRLLHPTHIAALVNNAATLACTAVGGPVLQRLVELGSAAVKADLYQRLQPHMAAMVGDASGSYLVQALLQHTSGTLLETVVKDVTQILLQDPLGSLGSTQGSRVLQKLVAYGSDDTVKELIDCLVSGEDDEVRANHDDDDDVDATGEGDDADDSSAPPLSRKQQRLANRSKVYHVSDKRVLSFALHQHACFAVRALLVEATSRQLHDHRKRLMNRLKPHVFDLAVSPWSGRLVLDTMLSSGSAELKSAIKEVVFLKAERWLSDTPVHAKGQAGIDPTMRKTLRGNADGREPRPLKKARVDESADVASKKKPQKKLFRSLKK